MNKMNVIAFRATSHVLGVATCNTQPDKAITVDAVAAHGIVVRAPDDPVLRALIDQTQLKVALVDYDTRVFYRPQLFLVTEDLRVEQQDETAVTADLDGVTVDVTLPVNTLSDIEVFVHITGGTLTEPVVRAVPIAKNTKVGSSGLVLGSGDYTVLIFAPGYVTAIAEETVP
jgi:hypothetical protein